MLSCVATALCHGVCRRACCAATVLLLLSRQLRARAQPSLVSLLVCIACPLPHVLGAPFLPSVAQCVPNAHELLLRTRDPSTGREVQPTGPAAEACPRKGFVAAPGCVLLSADYKQAELRLMAHFR